MTKRSNDALFEALFRQAAIDNFEEKFAAIPADAEIAHTFSARHKAMMNKLFTRDRAHTLFVVTIPYIFQRAAAVLLLAVVVAAIIPNVRATVINALYAWTAQYVEFKGDTHTELSYWEPAYIPLGYAEAERFDTPVLFVVYYQNERGETLTFRATPKDASVSINNEEVSYRTETIENITYHIFESYDSGESNQIVWENDEALFNVNARLPIEELLAVAQSVSPT